MLSKEDNDTLGRVGPGTPMGEMMRQYWLPLMYALGAGARTARRSAYDCWAKNLIAFRATDGDVWAGQGGVSASRRVAVLRPQRGGRSALRLPRLEVRRRPALASTCLRSRPRATSRARCVCARTRMRSRAASSGPTWARSRRTRRRCREFEWCNLPEEQVHHQYKGIYECNYMQALEGDIDTSAPLLPARPPASRGQPTSYGVFHPGKAPHPRISVDTDYGVYYGAEPAGGAGQDLLAHDAVPVPDLHDVPGDGRRLRAAAHVHADRRQPDDALGPALAPHAQVRGRRAS